MHHHQDRKIHFIARDAVRACVRVRFPVHVYLWLSTSVVCAYVGAGGCRCGRVFMRPSSLDSLSRSLIHTHAHTHMLYGLIRYVWCRSCDTAVKARRVTAWRGSKELGAKVGRNDVEQGGPDRHVLRRVCSRRRGHAWVCLRS